MKNLLSLFAFCLFLACHTAQAQNWQNRDIKGNWKFSSVPVCEQGEVAKGFLEQIFEKATVTLNGKSADFTFSTEDGITTILLDYKWSNATKLISFDFSRFDNPTQELPTSFLTQIYKARINAGNQLELFFVVDNPQPDANTKPTYVLTFIAQ